MAKKLATLALFALTASANDRNRDAGDRTRPTTCSMTKEECATFLKTSAPECEAWTDTSRKEDFFDAGKCCPKCKRVAPAERDTSKKCTKDDVEKCIESARPCDGNEIADPEEKLCCKTCAAPERKKTLRDVARCGKRDVCDDGEDPTDNDGCPSCRRARPKPTCDPACGEKQICVKKRPPRNNATTADGAGAGDVGNVCVGKKKPRKFKMKVRAGAKQLAQSFTSDATEEEIRAAVIELVARVCENPEFSKPCEENQQEIIDKLIVKINERVADEEVDFEVTMPEEAPEEAPSRRLEDSMSDLDLVEKAINENFDGDFSFEKDAAEDKKSSAWIKGASLALCMGLLLLV